MLRCFARFGALILLAGVTAAAPARAGDSIVVGVLENLSPNLQARIQQAYGTAATSVVRVAFRRAADGWVAFPDDIGNLDQLQSASQQFPASLDWTIAFDGKSLGRIESARPKQWLAFSDIGLHFLLAGERVPHVGNPGSDFAQWGADGAVYRPLILVSAPNVQDPDGWQRAAGDDSLVRSGMDSFRAAVQKENTKFKLEDGKGELLKAYRSRSGSLLFALIVTGQAPAPDEVPGPEWSPHWFVTDSSGQVRFLGSELLLIDAGDYGGDGHSELIFAKSSYDYDGYLMFYDDFRRSAAFGWNYQ
ncbi:MAG TPA: hypothetical protein VN821_00510 [Candidatus Udaeobacter sp.]|nr:hypothetical protein [Candidatus Udaeobacter sp.]